jgi:hypothetical protein
MLYYKQYSGHLGKTRAYRGKSGGIVLTWEYMMMSATEPYTVEQISDAIDQGDVDTLKAACQVAIRERGRGRGRHDSESYSILKDAYEQAFKSTLLPTYASKHMTIREVRVLAGTFECGKGDVQDLLSQAFRTGVDPDVLKALVRELYVIDAHGVLDFAKEARDRCLHLYFQGQSRYDYFREAHGSIGFRRRAYHPVLELTDNLKILVFFLKECYLPCSAEIQTRFENLRADFSTKLPEGDLRQADIHALLEVVYEGLAVSRWGELRAVWVDAVTTFARRYQYLGPAVAEDDDDEDHEDSDTHKRRRTTLTSLTSLTPRPFPAEVK